MDRKTKFYKLLEIFINETKKKELEEYYGEGTKLFIKRIDRSPSQNNCTIEVQVLLGRNIKEEYLESAFADVLVNKAFKFFYPEFKVSTIVSWDA